MRIDLMEMLAQPDEEGWRWTPTIELKTGEYVDDPSKFRDGEPGRIYGPALVELEVSPSGSRTLRVR
jgi:hypothetical protein